MANLNLKWGWHANLPTTITAADVGTIFVTKDEKSLYLGIESGQAPKRIQGVVQYYESTTAFTEAVKPPYSSDVIYYVASENALVRWDNTTKKFVIINVTAKEFTDTVTSLTSDIGANLTKINGINAKVGESADASTKTTAFGRIKALEEAVDALEELTGSSGDGTSLADRIGALETWKSGIDTWKTSASTDITNLKASDTTNTAAIATNKSKIEGLDTRLGTAEDEIDTLQSGLTTTNSNVTSLTNRVQTAEGTITNHTGTINQHTEDIGGLTTGLQTTNSNVSNLTNRVTQAEKDIDALESRADGYDTTLEDLSSRVSAAETTIEGHTTSINTHTTDITTNKTDITTLKTNLGVPTTETAKEDGSAFERILALKNAHKTLNDTVSGINTSVTGLRTDVDNVTSDVTTLKSDMTQAKSDIAANQTAIAGKADSSTVTTLTNKVSTNEQSISDHATKIKANADAIKATNDAIGTTEDAAGAETVYGAIKQVAGDLATETQVRTTLAQEVAALKESSGTSGEDISQLKTDVSGIKATIGSADDDSTKTSLYGKIAKAQSTADAAKTQSETNKSDIATLTNKFTEYYTKQEVDDKDKAISDSVDTLETTLNNKIDEHIKAANALTYKGGVDATQWADIKAAADTVRIGDTYVVTPTAETFDINGASVVCHAGDLLIATAKTSTDEDADGFLAPANIVWVHVASGYQKEMQGKLEVSDGDGASANKQAKLTLTSLNGSGTKGDLGVVTVASACENLEITTSASGMSINMVWGTF